MKIEGSERLALNPGHLACAASALPLSYDNRTTTPGSHSVCAVRTPIGVDRKVAARCATEAFQYHMCSTYRGLWGLALVCVGVWDKVVLV